MTRTYSQYGLAPDKIKEKLLSKYEVICADLLTFLFVMLTKWFQTFVIKKSTLPSRINGMR